MKKYLNLGFIIVSSFLFSACGLPKNTSSDNSESNQKSADSYFSLRQLIAQNIPQKCTYSGQNEAGSFDSEIIINGQKFHQIITFKSTEGEEKINSISDGEYIYTWGSHSTGGTFATKLKANFDETENNNKSISENISSAQTDLDSEFQGDCKPIIISDTDFQPPTDIKFEDYSKFLDDLKSSIPSIDSTDLE